MLNSDHCAPEQYSTPSYAVQAKRRAELTSRRTAVFLVASVAVVAGCYLGYHYSVMDAATESVDSSSSSRDSSAGREGSVTRSGSASSQGRRDIGAYVRGLFRTWSS